MKKRVLAVLMTAALIVGACPAYAWGEELSASQIQAFEEQTEEFQEEESADAGILPEEELSGEEGAETEEIGAGQDGTGLEEIPKEENGEDLEDGQDVELFGDGMESADTLFTQPEEPEEFSDGGELFSSEAKASASSCVITSCSGIASGKIRITARVPSPVKSVDKYYYLFQVNPISNKLQKRITRTAKPEAAKSTITFTLDTAGHPEYVMAKYAIAVKTKSGSKLTSFTRASGTSYVSAPEKTSANQAAYFVPATKKGLQTTNIQELTQTKSKTAFFNLPVSILLANNAERVPYKYNGKTYYFNKIGGYTQLVRQCNQKGIQVTVQIMLDWSSATKSLTASGAKGSRAAYYAWNTKNAAAREKMEALFSFTAELFSANDCYVSNWILGNEINTYSVWHYPGNMSKAEYITNYSESFRSLYNAVRSKRASSKVFLCVDHYWNMTVQGYAAKDVVDSVAKKLNTIQKGVNWNLAYHAYPYPLTDCRFWSGKNSNYLTNRADSPIISLNNLSALTSYIRRTYGANTRILLSEQGFTSTVGQDAQAAAVALGYYIAACNPMVDAFIIRSYQDESHEMAQGLAMGIKGKKAFRVFVNMDSSKSLNYTKTYLQKQVGTKWSKKVPGYNAKRLYTMYRSA